MVRPSRHSVAALISAFLLSLFTIIPASANNTAQPLPFSQNWTNTGLITAANWNGVAGIEGYFGRDITTSTGIDPQTLLGVTADADLGVFENQTNIAITSGGVAEFELTDPVVALQGSGTADAPYLLFHLDTTGAATSRSRTTCATSTAQPTTRFSQSPSSTESDPAATSRTSRRATSRTRRPAEHRHPRHTVIAVLPAAANNQPLVQVRDHDDKRRQPPARAMSGLGSTTSPSSPGRTLSPRRRRHRSPVNPTPTPTPTPAPAAIKVSQVYGGGGNAGATLQQRLHRAPQPDGRRRPVGRLVSPVRAAGGTTWTPTTLSGTIAAGGYYLIQEAAGTGGTLPLPDPDATGNIAMSATNGKVALVHSTTALSGACPANLAIVDLVGYGPTANCFEGEPTAVLSNTTAALRDGDGATDTNNNFADFTIAAPNPRAAHDSSPKVISTFPAAGSPAAPVWANINLGFNEPVTVADGWYLDRVHGERHALGHRLGRARVLHAQPR